MKLSTMSEETKAIIASNLTVAAIVWQVSGPSRTDEATKTNISRWFKYYSRNIRNFDEKK